jgi:DNA polymerase-3 subunit alpha
MVDDFILRKKGVQSIDYFHPDLTKCLDPTYGVIVYQEQVMQISQIIGGYTLGGADLLRRAMGKKKAEEMAEHRSLMADGAQKKGYPPELAEQLFDLMAKFAEYGFNKSHTAAYAVVTYQTAWLKAHYCSAFMAASLSSDMDNTDTVYIFYKDATSPLNQLTILPPDVNVGDYRFTPIDAKTIRYGLGAVKGVGQHATELIIAERNSERGAFKSLFDFCLRLDKRQVNKRTVEALIKAGAFDAMMMSAFGMSSNQGRAQLLASVELAMAAAEQQQNAVHQTSLFDDFSPSDEGGGLALVNVPAWTDQQRLLEEKAAIGFFISGHLYHSYQAELKGFVRTTLANIQPSKELQWLAGIVAGVRTQMTRRGKMVVVTLDDGSASIELTVFNELYEQHRQRLQDDQLLIVQGKVSKDEYAGGLRVVADRICTLSEARGQFAKHLMVQIDGRKAISVPNLKALLSQHKPQHLEVLPTPIRIDYRNALASCQLALGAAWSVSVSDELLQQLRQQDAITEVGLVY